MGSILTPHYMRKVFRSEEVWRRYLHTGCPIRFTRTTTLSTSRFYKMLESKVLIIGAGLGGLVLAHILRKNKVPVEIFERDDHISSRKQGWAVALMEYVFNLTPQSIAVTFPLILRCQMSALSQNCAPGRSRPRPLHQQRQLQHR